MAWGWQHWLSPRPLRRTPTSSEPHILGAHDAVLFQFLEEDGRKVIRETHYADNKIVRDGLSGPPLHIHLLQTEYFKVEQGVIGIHKNGREIAATENDGVVQIPAGTRKEDLIFKVWTHPQDLDHGFDEKFIRNLIGYQRDCQRANLTPSIFQLILFGYGSATLGTPPFWLPLCILKLVHYLLAVWIAAALLGYKESYPEYSPISDGYSHNVKKSS
ncbi:hypothetical protein DL771_000702 [Monosporascus sp. 5C6A]|nr:hypothetical protein DL771_000702 [Monosporascus sp. 5C6A]